MGLIDLVFPKRCLECRKEGKYICDLCIKKVAYAGPKEGLVSVWRYEGVIRKAIIALKYKYALEVAEELANYLIPEVVERRLLFGKDPILIPIPIQWYRGNYRGFNQAHEIGKRVTKHFGWRAVPDLLIRKKFKLPQTELKRYERIENIKGVFVLNPYYKPSTRAQAESLHSTNYILFDDVATTGSTLKEATKVLKAGGAQKVWGLTIAS